MDSIVVVFFEDWQTLTAFQVINCYTASASGMVVPTGTMINKKHREYVKLENKENVSCSYSMLYKADQ